MSKVRIVHTIPMGAGGISNLTLTINERIDREKYEFIYLVFRDREEFCDTRARELGSPKMIVDVEKIKNPIVKGICKVVGISKALRKERIEIIHIDASTPYDVVIAVGAKIAGVKKIIFHSHNDNYERKITLRNALQPIFRILIPMVVTDYIAISEQAAKFMFPKWIVNKKKYYLFKNGIDINKYLFCTETREKYRKNYNWTEHFVIGHIGRFVYQKNHSFLIDIFNEIVKIRSDALLVLIGIGELQLQIRDKVKELGLMEKIVFWGTTNDVASILQAMDCFIFPSNYEGLGMVAIEAQCAGLPTIVSDVLPPEINISKHIKRISLSKKASEWAKETLEFAYNDVRDRCGDDIRKSGYDVNEVVRKLEKLYIEN